MDSISYTPLYLQLKDVLLKKIADGVYKPGEIIPSEMKLAADFGTSISTVRQALSILVSDGFLVKKQGRGTFVSTRRVKLTFLSWIGESKRGLKILQEMITLFQQKHPSIEVEIIPTTYPETRRDLMKMISAGNAPDVAQIVSHWTSYFASMGAFEPLDSILSKKNLESRFNEKDLLGGTYQNKLYSVAWGLCPISLIANRKVLAGLGITSVDAPMALDGFDRLCRKISKAFGSEDKYCYGLPKANDETDFLRIYTFLQAFQGGFVNEHEEVIFNSRENLRGFKWLRSFTENTKIYVADIYTIRRKFAENRIAFISDGPWIKYILEELTGDEFEKNFIVLLNPVSGNGKSYSWNYNHALAVCAQSKNKLYAAKFIDAVTGDARISNTYYSTVGHLPVDAGYFEKPVYDSEYFSAYRKQLAHSLVLNAQNSMFEKAMVLCQDAVRKILFEKADIEAELDEKEYYLKMLYYG